MHVKLGSHLAIWQRELFWLRWNIRMGCDAPICHCNISRLAFALLWLALIPASLFGDRLIPLKWALRWLILKNNCLQHTLLLWSFGTLSLLISQFDMISTGKCSLSVDHIFIRSHADFYIPVSSSWCTNILLKQICI